MDRYLAVGIAQPVERQIVVLDVVGSNPTTHPTLLKIKRLWLYANDGDSAIIAGSRAPDLTNT